jgi:hypothetical protein
MLYTRRWWKEHLIVDMYVDDLIITKAWEEDSVGRRHRRLQAQDGGWIPHEQSQLAHLW